MNDSDDYSFEGHGERTVVSLPTWKRGATSIERLEEVLRWAKENPSRFDRLIVGWMEENEDGSFVIDYTLSNLTTAQMLGMLRLIEWKLRDVVCG